MTTYINQRKLPLRDTDPDDCATREVMVTYSQLFNELADERTKLESWTIHQQATVRDLERKLASYSLALRKLGVDPERFETVDE
jgi:hypothetical protein